MLGLLAEAAFMSLQTPLQQRYDVPGTESCPPKSTVPRSIHHEPVPAFGGAGHYAWPRAGPGAISH
jgi:hypothetical protein